MNFLAYLKLHGSDILLEAFANYFGNDEYFNLDITGVSKTAVTRPVYAIP